MPETLSADQTALLMYANGIELFERPDPASTDGQTPFLCHDHVGKRHPALTIGDGFKTAIRVRLFACPGECWAIEAYSRQ